ncbi:putative Peroxisomal 2,4-dienoyl-CoA reductase SPS19 [Glarea lozoyensis 74030]|uniref:2,4-dienoyl-CoA reductase [(3E)-enoyl-CoA-producing] n=1 Tax=Glarea lozoyensis (strain ATCC 74030 / MF5533) TaxID=1104152 RepID=H0EJS8_GLAL7|nr:putative Peroxisomal 2,4-dienoyl-CoA reductase SPS19 [Glarea lozoyensis 74030]
MALPRSEYLSSTWRDGIFDNKVVFCTGGGGTICSAQVRALVHLGANACILGRNVEKTEKMAQSIATARKGAKVIGIGGADVRSIESLEKAVERCVRELGGIDYVIAGAAGNFLSPIAGLSANAFKTVMDIDTLGGRILFISAAFHYTGMPLQTHAAAAKAGVDAIMAGTALEYGPYGITSNVITPGPIAGTEGMARLGDPKSEATGAAQRKNPLGRYGTVKEIADGTVYLFADTGSYVNGEVLVIDGGGWRSTGAFDGEKTYPDYLLDGTFTKKAKL